MVEETQYQEKSREVFKLIDAVVTCVLWLNWTCPRD